MDNKSIRKKYDKKLDELMSQPNMLGELIAPNSHIDRHMKNTDAELLERLLTKVPANSQFTSDDKAQYFIEEAIIYSWIPIMNWLETTNKPSIKFQVNLKKDQYDEIVGTGFRLDKETNTIKEYETNTITLIIEKHPEMPYGFSVKTAYPELETPRILPTNRNLQDIVKQTDTYRNADNVGKAFLVYRTNPENKLHAHYRKGHTSKESKITFTIPTKQSDIEHHVTVTEDDMSLVTLKSNNGTKRRIHTPYTNYQRSHSNKDDVYVDLSNENTYDYVKQKYENELETIYHVWEDIADNVDKSRNRYQQAENSIHIDENELSDPQKTAPRN